MSWQSMVRRGGPKFRDHLKSTDGVTFDNLDWKQRLQANPICFISGTSFSSASTISPHTVSCSASPFSPATNGAGLA